MGLGFQDLDQKAPSKASPRGGGGRFCGLWRCPSENSRVSFHDLDSQSGFVVFPPLGVATTKKTDQIHLRQETKRKPIILGVPYFGPYSVHKASNNVKQRDCPCGNLPKRSQLLQGPPWYVLCSQVAMFVKNCYIYIYKGQSKCHPSWGKHRGFMQICRGVPHVAR